LRSVDREIHRAIPEALERLSQAQDAALAAAANVFEIYLEGYHLLAASGLVEHRSFRTADYRTPVAAVADAVDVEHEALVGGRRGPRD
jgi:hypothetical protein